MAKTTQEIAAERVGISVEDVTAPDAPPSSARNKSVYEENYRSIRAKAHDPSVSIEELERHFSYLDAPAVKPQEVKKPEELSYFGIAGKNIGEILPQAGAGVINAVAELGNTTLDLADWAENKLHREYGIGPGDLISDDRVHGLGQTVLGEPETITGALSGGVAEFMAGFLPTNRVLQGAKIIQGARGAAKIIGQFAAGSAAGGVADFSAFDPHQDRLSNFIQRKPWMANSVSEYLAADPKDTNIDGRFKNMLEGFGFGAITEGLFLSFKAYKASRAAQKPQITADPKTVIAETAAAEQKAAGELQIEMPPAGTDIPLPDADPLVVGGSRSYKQKSGANFSVKRDELGFIAENANGDKIGRLSPVPGEGVPGVVYTDTAVRGEGVGAALYQEFLDANKGNIRPSGDTSKDAWKIWLERYPNQAKDFIRERADSFIELNKVKAESGNPPFTTAKFSPHPKAQELYEDAVKTISGGKEWNPDLGIGRPRMVSKESEAAAADAMLRSRKGGGLAGREAPGSPISVRPDMPPPAPVQAAQEAPGAAKAAGAPVPPIEPTIDMRNWDLGGPGSFQITKRVPGRPIDAYSVELPTGDLFNVNLTNITSIEDYNAAMKQIGDLIEPTLNKAKVATIADKHLREMAIDAGIDPVDLYTRLGGEAFNARKMVASQIWNVGSAKNLKAKAIQAMSPNATIADKAAFAQGTVAHLGSYQAMIGAESEAGRTLHSIQLLKKSDREMLDQMAELIRSFGGESEINAMADLVSKMDSTRQINKAMAKTGYQTMVDSLLEFYTNSLLSNPVTLAAATITNTAAVFGKIATRAAAAGISFGRGVIRDVPRESMVAPHEPLVMMGSLLGGTMDAMRVIVHDMRKGKPLGQYTQAETARLPAISAASYGQVGMFGKTIDMMGNGIRSPGKALGVIDKFFQMVNQRMDVHAEAAREAWHRGLSGSVKDDFVKDFVYNQRTEVKMRTAADAREATFARELPESVARVVSGLQQYTLFKIIAPFPRSSLNMMDYALQHTPGAGYLSSRLKTELAAGGARADIANAKMAFGGTMMSLGGLLAFSGIITGSGPKDPESKRAWEMSGKRAYSVKVDDVYYSFSRLDPFGNLLGMSADFADVVAHIDDMDAQGLALSAMEASTKNILPEMLIESLVDFSEAVTNKEKFNAYMSSKAASAVPNLFTVISKSGGSEKLITKDESFFQQTLNKIRSKIPGLGEGMTPYRNMFGDAITYDPGLGPDIASPIYTSVESKSPIRLYIAHLIESDPEKYKFDMPIKMIPSKMRSEGIPLSNAQYDKLVQYAAGIGAPGGVRTLEDELNFQLKHNFPNEGIDFEEKKLDHNRYVFIQKTIRFYRNYANNRLVKEDPDIENKIVISREIEKSKRKGVTLPGGIVSP